MPSDACLANLPRLNDLAKREGFDAVIATSPENVTYLSGFWAMSQWVRRGPQAYCLYPLNGEEPALIANSSILDLVADQKPWVSDVRRYGYFQIDVDASATLEPDDATQSELFATDAYAGSVEALVAAMKEKGVAKGRIALDETGITPQCMDELLAALPEATFVRSFGLFQRVRAVKTPVEIDILRDVAAITQRAIEASLAVAREGVSEREMLRAFNGSLVADDALPVTGCIGFGPRSAMINAQPSDRQLRPGDLIRFDVGARYKHYRSDMARGAVLGEPDKRTAAAYAAVEKGIERSYEIIKPGLKVADLFTEVVETVRREGIPGFRRSHVGHGIGIDGYDPPTISEAAPEVLEENMVLCLETPYYELGFGGFQVEDMLRVTRDGVESFMTLPTALRVV
ncbi:M24 family metallopeptidase [Acuticoccus mangrovi]|uniref:Aminopeptidase P family protein n=1 Tax=Acuticoccus mangrovi TaxID=2796142 RepID=A0A934IQ27_9HYPH|nr:Xaa-Pro peptidase family protein [Acuticoccus mangrovi]MBJ3776630.1 aminopeptidase P family protein [Acuticoccus mangrovi]